jgi:DNA-directed RNA polymerase specialized sigma24 family protein
MPDATKRPLSEWRDTEWLQHLQRQAQRLTACPYSADDLAHTCLIAFYDHHRCYPWQHPEPAHALRWCCQKLRALACDAHRYAQRHPCLTLETLPESVACVDIAAQVQGDIDGERFVASLPPRLHAAVELRLAGYSWDEAAQQLGVSASTLRGYLPELRAKFVDFFGYDPSKRASESLIRAEGKTAPSDDRGGNTDEGNTRIGERLGDDTEHELPENPVPFLPNPTGPINVGIRFCNAMVGTGSVISGGTTCRNFVYDTEEGSYWCENHPKCNGNSICCVKECARILGVNPDQTINDWTGAYCKLWENIQ